MKTRMRGLSTLLLLLVVALLLAGNVRAAPQGDTLAQDFPLTADDAMSVSGFEARADGLELVGPTATLVTPGLTAGWQFIALGVTWDDTLPDDLSLRVEARVGDDGYHWGDWITLDRMQADGPDGTVEVGTDLLFAEGTYAQVRVTATRTGSEPYLLRGLKLTVIDGRSGPDVPPAAPDAPLDEPPAVVSRAGWGANESYRFDANGNEIWPREYWTLRGFFVHHTATSPTNPPSASVRSIYYYHAVTLGWGDIGYHYIVDQNGTIYQGRYGTEQDGLVVEGGHTLGYNRHTMGVSMIGNFVTVGPPAAQLAAAKEILAWRAYTYGIDPYAPMWLDGVGSISPDRWFDDSILGHRDSHTPARTTCPGDAGYAKLPEIRQYVSARIGQLALYVHLTNPAPGSTLAGWVTLAATTSPNVVRVEYELDGSVIAVSNGAPWSVSVDAASLPVGAYTLTAVGYTADGRNTSDARPVEVALADEPAITPTVEPTRTPTATPSPTATYTPSPTPTGTPVPLTEQTYLPLVYFTPPLPPPPPPPRCQGLLPNSDFHTNDGWVLLLGDVAARYASEQAWDGARSLRVGMDPAAPYRTASWSSARRLITIPNDGRSATLTLHFLRQSDNASAGGDRQYLGILDASGTYVQSVIPSGMTHDGSWQSTSFDLAGYLGQTIYLYVGVQNNGDAVGTRMYIDDIQVTMCGE